MIGAGKSAGIALLGCTDMRPAMTTRINQRMNRAIHRAGNNNRIRFDVSLEKITGIGDLTDMTRDQPMAAIKSFHVAFKNCRIAVKGLVKRATMLLPHNYRVNRVRRIQQILGGGHHVHNRSPLLYFLGV